MIKILNQLSFVKIKSIFDDDDHNKNDIYDVILIDENNNADINFIVNYRDCMKCYD